MKTQAQFRAYVSIELWPVILDMIKGKGHQYTGEEQSVFTNFEEGAADLNETKEQYLLNLAEKQWRVLADWSKRGTLEEAASREVVQRIFDVIVYMLLLLYMLAVKREEQS